LYVTDIENCAGLSTNSNSTFRRTDKHRDSIVNIVLVIISGWSEPECARTEFLGPTKLLPY